MIESVSTLSGVSTASRIASQGSSSSSLPPIAPAPQYGGSRIFVNNLQNVAVLQDVDADGQVTAQYPTPAQIQAFRTAEKLAAQQQEVSQLAPATSDGGSSASNGSSGGIAQAAAAAQSTPSVSNIIVAMTTASYTSSGAQSAPSAQSSTQSVDA